jgi:predicted nucleic acid-binding protein
MGRLPRSPPTTRRACARGLLSRPLREDYYSLPVAWSEALTSGDDQAAPHVIDVEVFGVVRRAHQQGQQDGTAAAQAVEDLYDWPGQRFGHRPLLARAWELQSSVRGWDAMYVALAEALDVVLVTTDARLAAAPGPTCEIEVIGSR